MNGISEWIFLWQIMIALDVSFHITFRCGNILIIEKLHQKRQLNSVGFLYSFSAELTIAISKILIWFDFFLLWFYPKKVIVRIPTFFSWWETDKFVQNWKSKIWQANKMQIKGQPAFSISLQNTSNIKNLCWINKNNQNHGVRRTLKSSTVFNLEYLGILKCVVNWIV